MPTEPFEVNTNPPGKDGWDILLIVVSIIGGLAAIIGAIAAFIQLFKKDEDKQNQLKELKGQTEQLIKQNQLFEKRIRMMVKPMIWSNGDGIKPSEKRFNVRVDNRGQIGFITEVKLIDGDSVGLRGWKDKTITIAKDNGSINLTGDYGELDPKTMSFRFLIKYHDSENFRYETIFKWESGRCKVIETKEL